MSDRTSDCLAASEVGG